MAAPSEAATTRTSQQRPAREHARRLSDLAAGGATALALGGLVSAILALLPLKLGQIEWQIAAISTLLSNGPWILLGLVLLHLACLLQPRDGALLQRLGTARRLATVGTLLFLLISPLPPLLTWRSLAVSQSGRERVINTSSNQLLAYRRAITESVNLADLKQRMAAIPGSAPLPEQLNRLPFRTVREGLLAQLTQTEQRVQTRLRKLENQPNLWEPWRKAIQASFGSLMLALGFSSGAQGLRGGPKALIGRGRGPTLSSLLSLPARLVPKRWRSKGRSKSQLALQRSIKRLNKSLSRTLFGTTRSRRRLLLRGWRLPGLKLPGRKTGRSRSSTRSRRGRGNKLRSPS